MVPDYGKVWYDNKDMENIFSLTNLVKKEIFTYDPHQDDTSTVHTNIGIIKFRRNKQGLYVFNLTYTTANLNVVNTVEDNMMGLTRRQIERAKLSRKIYNNIGLPTVKKFKDMVSKNMKSNCPISVEDIKNAEKYMLHRWKVSKKS